MSLTSCNDMGGTTRRHPAVGNITSPHDVLDRILSAAFPAHTILSKPSCYFTERSRHENRLSASIYQLKYNFACFFRLLRRPTEKYIFREYDGFSFLYLVLPLSVDIKFNVNHNLATWYGRIITRLLSMRFDVLFVDPSERMLRRYGYLQGISSLVAIGPCAESNAWDKTSVLIFSGSRKDQRNYTRTELTEFSSMLVAAGYSVTVLGKNHPQGTYLSEAEYLSLLKKSLAICTCAYKTCRHSGTLWTLKEHAPVILFNASECGAEQLQGHSKCYCFSELSGAVRLIEELAAGRRPKAR